MKFYKISSFWYQAISENNVVNDLYLNQGSKGCIMEGNPAMIGPMVGEEITKEEYLLIFNQIISNYENYFKTEGSHSSSKADDTKIS